MQKEWIENIYGMISYFSDINTLSNSWYGFDKKNASYFGEEVSLLFDSFSFDNFIEDLRSKSIRKELLEAIVDFRDHLFSYEEPKSGLALDILNDPNFLKIVDKAKLVIDQWDIGPTETKPNLT